MNHHTLSVPRTAHIFSLGQLGPQVRQLWIVCHGFAMLADEFLENFRPLEMADGSRLIVAPEGLNHFYKRGHAGDVGTTWMTRRFRETQIADYANYLQTLLHQQLAVLPPDVRVVLFGFSQGTATVCRWVLAKHPPCHDIVLWGGLPPEDLDYRPHLAYLSGKRLQLWHGDGDPLFTPEWAAMLAGIEAKNGLSFSKTVFAGGHDIPAEALLGLGI